MRRINIVVFMLLVVASSCTKELSDNNIEHKFDAVLNKENPVTINLWHYYNSAQKEKFDSLVDAFNTSIGAEYGVYLKSTRRAGNVGEIASLLSAALEEQVVDELLPDIFSAYPDTAYELNQKGLLADLSQYLTTEEKNEYVQPFLYSSGFGKNDEIKLFPIVKATEVLVINKTAWKPFAEAMGVSYRDLKTWEGLVQVAELYYKWTDSLTDTLNDGKPFFGRDALSNYILTGAYELGNNIFNTLENGSFDFFLDKKVFKTCWDNYYIPFLKGFFTAKGKFRSDDLKTGDIIACVISTSSSGYLPSEIIDAYGNVQKIELDILPVPHFRNAKMKTIVQQGAGMAVLKSSLKKEMASVLFLKWFTEMNQYLEFASVTGYLPVKIKNLNQKVLVENNKDMNMSKIIQDTLRVGIEEISSSQLYFQPGFRNSDKARYVLANLLNQKAKENRTNVVNKIKDGSNYVQILTPLISDKEFEIWFKQLEMHLYDLK